MRLCQTRDLIALTANLIKTSRDKIMYFTGTRCKNECLITKRFMKHGGISPPPPTKQLAITKKCCKKVGNLPPPPNTIKDYFTPIILGVK